MRHTRNRSLPGCHAAEDLTLQGHVFGLGLAGSSEAQAVEALRAHGFSPLARRTKVSLARFARLAVLVHSGLASSSQPGEQCDRASSVASSAAAAPPCLPQALCTSTVLMAFAWATARSKAELLAFFEAATSHLPTGALLSAHVHDPASRDRWLHARFDRADAADGTSAALAAASCLARPSSTGGDERHVAESLELLAFAIACRGSERPEVEQVRHGFRGQTVHTASVAKRCTPRHLSHHAAGPAAVSARAPAMPSSKPYGAAQSTESTAAPWT